jgi:hypothetical protein
MNHCGGSRPSGPGAIGALFILWMLAGGFPAVPGAAAQGQTVEQLEAAVVMTFARFVEWSPADFPSATAPIVIGIVADETVAVALEAGSRGRNVAGRTIAVKRLQWDSVDAGVHMLFAGDMDPRHLAILLDRVRTRPIVTVSRLPGFGRAGGMITLTLTDGRITFAVNSSATAASGVRLSSFLLSHATKVSAGPGGGLQ